MEIIDKTTIHNLLVAVCKYNNDKIEIVLMPTKAKATKLSLDETEELSSMLRKILDEYGQVGNEEENLRDKLEKDGCKDLAKDGYDKEMIKKLESELCNKYREVYESSRNSQVPRNKNLLSCYELYD